MVKKLRARVNLPRYTLVLELIGIVLVVIGVSSLSVSAGLITGGLALVGIGYLLE